MIRRTPRLDRGEEGFGSGGGGGRAFDGGGDGGRVLMMSCDDEKDTLAGEAACCSELKLLFRDIGWRLGDLLIYATDSS
jgi:hypothetical protein